MNVESILRSRKRPDNDPWFIAPVVQGWWENYQDDGQLDKPHALPGSRVRASWAGMCARRIAYGVANIEETDPTTVADAWRMNIGTLLHDHIQKAIIKAFPGSEAEVKVPLLGGVGSGHMDLMVKMPDGKRISCEIKSVNGFGFKKMVSSSNPEGPRLSYMLQAALNAAAMDPLPDEMVIAVFSLECISPSEAQKNSIRSEYGRFSAQWSFTQEEFLAIAAEESARLNRIVELVDESGPVAVPRIIPDPTMPSHVVIRPDRGLLALKGENGEDIGTGFTWHCGYCSYQTRCSEDNV